MQQVTGVLCLGLVGLIVAANLGCAPKYFQRGDVIALLAIGLIDTVLLLGASSGESNAHRLLGVAASASAAALFLSTVSIPALFAPLAIAGTFRVPSGRRRATAIIAIPLAILATAALLLLGQSFVTAAQFRCP